MRLRAYTPVGEAAPKKRTTRRATERAIRPRQGELKLAERHLAAKLVGCDALRRLCESAPAGRYDEFVDALAPILGPAQYRTLKAMLGGADTMREHLRRLGSSPAIRIAFRESAAGTDAPKAPKNGAIDDLCARLGVEPDGVLARVLASALDDDNTDDTDPGADSDDTEESISGSDIPMQESSRGRIAIAFDQA